MANFFSISSDISSGFGKIGNVSEIANLSNNTSSSTITLNVPPELRIKFILTCEKLPFNSSSSLEACGK